MYQNYITKTDFSFVNKSLIFIYNTLMYYLIVKFKANLSSSIRL